MGFRLTFWGSKDAQFPLVFRSVQRHADNGPRLAIAGEDGVCQTLGADLLDWTSAVNGERSNTSSIRASIEPAGTTGYACYWE